MTFTLVQYKQNLPNNQRKIHHCHINVVFVVWKCVIFFYLHTTLRKFANKNKNMHVTKGGQFHQKDKKARVIEYLSNKLWTLNHKNHRLYRLPWLTSNIYPTLPLLNTNKHIKYNTQQNNTKKNRENNITHTYRCNLQRLQSSQGHPPWKSHWFHLQVLFDTKPTGPMLYVPRKQKLKKKSFSSVILVSIWSVLWVSCAVWVLVYNISNILKKKCTKTLVNFNKDCKLFRRILLLKEKISK